MILKGKVKETILQIKAKRRGPDSLKRFFHSPHKANTHKNQSTLLLTSQLPIGKDGGGHSTAFRAIAETFDAFDTGTVACFCGKDARAFLVPEKRACLSHVSFQRSLLVQRHEAVVGTTAKGRILWGNLQRAMDYPIGWIKFVLSEPLEGGMDGVFEFSVFLSLMRLPLPSMSCGDVPPCHTYPLGLPSANKATQVLARASIRTHKVMLEKVTRTESWFVCRCLGRV